MRKLIVPTLILALAACATPYQEKSGLLGGVSTSQIGRDTYRIEGRLNAFSSGGMLQDYLLLRAAETAASRGAQGFIILGSQDTSRSGTIAIPGQAITTGSAYAVGNTAYGQTTTTYTPLQAFNIVKPGGLLMIQIVYDRVPEGMRYFSASEIISVIGSRVNSPRKKQDSPGLTKPDYPTGPGD
jgi:hypothetical protein